VAESDKFNQLIIDANFTWREVAILRAYCKYFRQIGFTFSETYIQETILNNTEIAIDLVSLFKSRLSPLEKTDSEDLIKAKILDALEKISNLDEDRILRRFLDVILATLRTNFFQVDSNSNFKNYISFKLNPALIPDLVLPLPMFEVFVYSARTEGVHLRGAKVARGGLRWSDRREDFRTEVLGLMKAQQVKNAVIVPAGAKGGFVCKQLPSGNRDEIMQEVIACYSTFIRGLLDITDNIINDNIVPAENIVRHDEDDPYLVVAADKGTATFSDIANGISAEYNFWLGDAFASGGSVGYDHKKMGITARGAFESVKRHFHSYNINVNTTDFTVVGIGDMAGDVFGNGLLLSKHMKLLAAFNHMHIFLDPNPEPTVSFAERERLFNLPRSTWQDYNEQLISPGGGVFSRFVKAIKLSSEIKQALGIDSAVESLMPNDLIKEILKAPVDLLWNGGIGTYVKASTETDPQVGDRSNDAVRINGNQLKCKVVGEGGNLGFTQLGRVEAALNNISLFTDFIDNSGGVDCSDHEVNLKILLNPIIKSGDMTIKQRNQLLEKMTDEVAQLVLNNNYNQGYAISLAASRSAKTLEEHAKFIRVLEREGLLNREIEFLPSDEQIIERKARNLGLTRPEIAVLMAYSKIVLKREILNSDLPNDVNVEFALETAFPAIIKESYAQPMEQHRLKAEIIATQISNEIINTMGLTYIKRLSDETGASTSDIVRAHMISQEILDKDNIVKQVLTHSEKIDSGLIMQVLFEYIRLIRRSTRWLLRNYRTGLDIKEQIEFRKPLFNQLWAGLYDVVSDTEKDLINVTKNKYIEAGMDAQLANKMAYIKLLYSAMDVTYICYNYHADLNQVARLYYAVGERLFLNMFRDQINSNPVDDNWDALARAAIRDDIDVYQREITIGILQAKNLPDDLEERLNTWEELCTPLIHRWNLMLIELKATKSKEFTIFSVALRELYDLAQLTDKILADK
ncbi:MAG: NAD-glutamate dehydrogenase, partial [Gammaproteobacteria bacterium]|nr:NAD-glutamate dehydrogenase [Gammaproteobacteria bacterium]